MIDFQEKINAFGTPTAFIDDQHDAEEFNSTHRELKNFITAARLALTALPGWAGDDISMMTQAAVVYSGLMFRDATAGGSPNARVNEPFGPSTIDVPPVAAMDNHSFRFRGVIPNTGSCTMNALGVTKDLKLLDGNDLPAGFIQVDGIYEVLWDNTGDRFLIYQIKAQNISQTDYSPNGTTNVPQSTDEENASFSTNGDIIHISGFLKWDPISGSPVNASFDLPQINGQQVKFKSTSILPSVTIRLPINVIVDGVSETNYMSLANGPSNPAVRFTTPASSLFISLNFSFPFELV